MSNPDPGPYWQDHQDHAGNGSGWRAGPNPASRQQSAWDDGNGFWRDDRSAGSAGRDSRQSRQSRHGAAQYRDSQSPARGSHRDNGRSAAGARRSADSDRGDWTGRLSSTADDLRSKADDLRNRLSSRTRSAASRVQARMRGAGEDGVGYGAAASPMSGNGAREGSRGARSAAQSGGYGPGDYGPGDYGTGGYDGRRAGGRTAMRQSAGELWEEPYGTSRGARTRIAERQLTGGGRGGGSGGGGGHGRGRYGGRGGGFTNWLLYGSWWRHWTWKKALAVMGGAIAVVFLLGIGVFFIMYESTPIPTASQFANLQSSTVYLANGHQMGVFDNGGVDRRLLTSQQIPSRMMQAMVAAEDRHFYSEGGVSFTGLLRSAYEDLRGNGVTQGGSTITMQYAKNYYTGVNTGQNLTTKFKEIFIAMKLAHKETKLWVMTSYLNTVPFGATIDGLGAAAESYFNIDLTQPKDDHLTLAQAALLASMPNNPAVFNSVVMSPKPQDVPGYTQLYQRFEYVLSGMVKDGNITSAQAQATKFPKITPPPSGNGYNGYTGYLMQMVVQQLEAPKVDGGYGLTLHQIDTGGYKIKTTFSMAKVNALAKAVSKEKNQMKLAAQQQGADSFRKYDRIGAVLENSKTGAIEAVYGGPGYSLTPKQCVISSCQLNMAEEAEPVGSSFKPYVLSEAVKLGMNVQTSKLNGYSPIWIPLGSVNGQSAQLTLSPTNPPPGCSNPSSTQASSACLSSNGAEYFLFNEPTENLKHPLAVNEAAAVSSDPAFEDLAHRDGVDNVIDMAKKLGVGQTAFVDPCPASSNGTSYADTLTACNDLTGPDNGLIPNFSTTHPSTKARHNGTPGSPAIALGENPLTPIEQASTFATLADGGLYHTPHVIQSLLQPNGSGGTTTVASPVATRRVLTAPQAADVDWALSFDNTFNHGNEQGTALATVPFAPGNLIAKTGTLGVQALASEAWFNGATRRLFSLSVALFTNLPGQQNLDNLPNANGTPGSQGGGWPASIFNAFMTRNVKISQIQQLAPPNTVGFKAWIMVKAQKPKKQFCKQGGGGFFGGGGGNQKNCVCPPHAQFCGQNNPNPGTSCHGNGNGNGNGNGCNSSSPAPSTSCQGFGGLGGQCSTPPPSHTPSPSPSVTPSTGKTASFLRTSPGLGILTVAGEEESARLTVLLGLLV